MTYASRLFSFFPVLVFLASGFSFYILIKVSFGHGLLGLMCSFYFFPLISFHIMSLFKPIKEGVYDLAKREFNPWWASHQIQYIYFAFPVLENILKIIPGAFSLWLNLWGSKIGKNVYWTPNISVNDRSLLKIGDNTTFGHRLEFLGHVVTPKGDRCILYVKKINIGSDVFIGAGSRFGPGVIIEDGAILGVLTDGEVNQRFKTGNHIKKRERST